MVAKKAKSGKNNTVHLIPDGELAGLRARLALKQEYIAVLELELFNTRADLNEFTEIYNRQIAPLQRQVNSLRKKLFKTLEERRAETGENGDDYPAMGINGMKRDEGPEAGEPDDPKDNGRKKKSKARISKNNAPKISPSLEARIRDLFRNLAKRFHPDLTSDPAEKSWREKIMAQVNQAYTARDLNTLLALAEYPDQFANSSMQSRSDELDYLKVELVRLDGVIREIEATLKQIEVSPIMQLRREIGMAQRDGRDLLADMTADLEMQIMNLVEYLASLGVEVEAEKTAVAQ
ncbi:MAG: J domain-containing protein [Anaerolineae bacterium]|nr:J domain-containing protein [Anaerolineae bacterium]